MQEAWHSLTIPNHPEGTPSSKKSYLPSPHMQLEALHSLFASTLISGTLWLEHVQKVYTPDYTP